MRLSRSICLIAVACMLLTVFPMSYSIVSADTGVKPVAHYTFDGSILDSSGNGNNGTSIVGNITYLDGPLGKAAVFDGKSYFEVNDSDSLDLGKELTFSLWLYDNPIPIEDNRAYFTKLGNDWNEGSAYGMGKMNMLPFVDRFDADTSSIGSNGKQSDKRLEAHKWQLLTTTYDGSVFKFYVNGVMLSQKESYGGTNVITSHGKLQIGMMDFGGKNVFYDGRMDDFRIYNKSLSQTEVQALFAEAMAGPGKELVARPNRMIAYYNFNKDANDYSGYANNGTVVGAVTYVETIASKGAKFNGSSYIEVNDSDSLEVGKGFTASAWFKLDNVEQTVQPFIDKLGSSINLQSEAYWMAIDTNNHIASGSGYKPYFGGYCFNNGDYMGGNMFDILSESTMMPAKWAMLTATFDGKSTKLYLDGKLISTQAMQVEDTIVHSKGKLMIGKLLQSGDTFFTKGIIDEIRLYNYALDEASIAKLIALKDGLVARLADGTVPTAMKVKESVQLNPKLATYAFTASPIVPGTGTDSYAETPITGVTYKSLTPKIATVDTNGKLTAIAKGKATIMLSYKDLVGYLVIDVN